MEARIALITQIIELALSYDKFTGQRILKWQPVLEEFHVKVLYVSGMENEVTDTLSRG